METEIIEKLSKTLFEDVVSTIITQENSPYLKIKKKILDIDIDYFETIQRDSNHLSNELSMSLREKVMKDFALLFDKSFIKSDLQENVRSLINERIVQHHHLTQEEKNCVLKRLKELLSKYAYDRLLFLTEPEYTIEELNNLYTQAQKVTWIENITESNKTDILQFYQVLLHRTAWDCENFLERETSSYLLQIIK